MHRRSLDRLQGRWEITDESRALKALLTSDAEWDVAEFLRTHTSDVADLLRQLEEHAFDWRRWR